MCVRVRVHVYVCACACVLGVVISTRCYHARGCMYVFIINYINTLHTGSKAEVLLVENEGASSGDVPVSKKEAAPKRTGKKRKKNQGTFITLMLLLKFMITGSLGSSVTTCIYVPTFYLLYAENQPSKAKKAKVTKSP